MKYFFLSDGWTVGRVWSEEGLWDDLAWRRSPQIERTQLSIVERGECLWLYRAEDTVIMLEVKPLPGNNGAAPGNPAIGQVVLKRLIDADRVIDRLSRARAACQLSGSEPF